MELQARLFFVHGPQVQVQQSKPTVYFVLESARMSAPFPETGKLPVVGTPLDRPIARPDRPPLPTMALCQDEIPRSWRDIQITTHAIEDTLA